MAGRAPTDIPLPQPLTPPKCLVLTRFQKSASGCQGSFRKKDGEANLSLMVAESSGQTFCCWRPRHPWRS